MTIEDAINKTDFVTAFRKRIFVQTMIDQNLVHPDNIDVLIFHALEAYDAAGVRFIANLLGCNVHEEVKKSTSYPKDWWNSFKERWFPKWAKTKWSVIYQSVDTVIEHWHICPHLAIPTDNSGNSIHINFLRSRN